MSDARTRVMQILDTERHYHVHTVTSDLLRLVAAEIERLTAETCDLTAEVARLTAELGRAIGETQQSLNEARAEVARLIAQRELWLEKLRTVTVERDEARALLARCVPTLKQLLGYERSHGWAENASAVDELATDIGRALGKETPNG